MGLLDRILRKAAGLSSTPSMEEDAARHGVDFHEGRNGFTLRHQYRGDATQDTPMPPTKAETVREHDKLTGGGGLSSSDLLRELEEKNKDKIEAAKQAALSQKPLYGWKS